ncbi:MAG: bifunctional metallophosphatase/5'-nucleotidase [Fusobacteriaceae bacterium]
MKKTAKIFGILGMILTFQACSTLRVTEEKTKDFELVVVHLNDVHGRVEEGKYDGVGYAKVATIIENLKKDSANKNIIFVDAGDTLHGTTFATLERGASIVKLLDKMNLEAMALGNHDFNYGQNRTLELNKMGKFEMLSANTMNEDGSNFITPYIIREIEGVKIGIFGLTTPETHYKTSPKNVEGLTFESPIPIAKKVVKELKSQGAQFIIALTHLGIDESTKPEFRSTALAEEVPEINLIVDGHSHTSLKEKMVVNGVTIIQTGEYSKNLGIAKIDFDELAKGTEAISYNLISKKEILDNGIEPNKEISDFIAEIKKEQNKITEIKIGKTDVKLVGEREFVRAGETNLANLITDAMVWKSDADMSITNGGGIRASINQGDITVGDVITVLPFGNYVVTKELTGKDIKDALEHGFRDLPNVAGSLSQIGGITLNLDIAQPIGQRVSNIKFNNGKKFSLTSKYVVATNDFMAIGGDDYLMFKGRKEIANYPGLDEILIDYIKVKGVTAKKVDGRVKIKK